MAESSGSKRSHARRVEVEPLWLRVPQDPIVSSRSRGETVKRSTALAKVSKLVVSATPFVDRFGLIAGLRLYGSLRDWTRRAGQLYEVRVRGLRGPVSLRAQTSDRDVFLQVLVGGELDFELEHPKLIIDAGANIGLSAINFATRFPGATIVCLEIDAANFEVLKRNVAPYPSIIPRLVGLWSRRGHLRIENPEAEHDAFRAVEVAEGTPGSVEAVGVADLVAEFGPISLLKMDIEGGECEVFSGGPPTWLRDIQSLAVELHDRFRPGCRAALDRALSGFNYRESSRGEYRVIRFS
jgi:FkbM family methyltransferase